MGDRATVVVYGTGPTPIYLYSHWGGKSVYSAVQRVLARRLRWNDSSYLTAMLYDGIRNKEDFGKETGYGISTEVPDYEYAPIAVDITHQTVAINEPGLGFMSFEEFLKVDVDI